MITYANAAGYNDSAIILASAARTATPAAITIYNPCASGLHLIVDVTASASTPSVVITVSGVDPVSGQIYTVLASAAFTGSVETRVLKIFPGATAATNLAANDFLPKVVQISFVHGDADSITYSVGAHFLR
jgi:hypothetical protein